MSRASFSITAILLSSLVLTACGGGGGGDNSQDSSSNPEPTITASSTTAAPTSNSCNESLAERGTVTMSLDEIPYCDPAPLKEMMAMDDPAYQNQLSNNWPDVEQLLYRYIPPNVTVFPAPLNFSGAMSTCLQQHGLPACREYMNLLIGLNEGKQP